MKKVIKQKPGTTTNPPTIGKHPVNQVTVGENVVREPNEFLVLDYKKGSSVPPQEKECGIMKQPVDVESTAGPYSIDSELNIGPLVALVRKHVVQ
jgi:hypothetical protein